MDQVFEGEPHADIQLQGNSLQRSDVTQDWGSKLQWKITRDGKEVAVAAARVSPVYEHGLTEPGDYEAVLQLFKYVNYKKDKDGAYTESKFVDISNKVTFSV
ncbi:hypothetical protein [Lignipirellula cremea]|uniref:Uncharacterized protein n=1 Tax=Lignipirellula cremea TaxID=2528010 RepID=A0A518E277_9BACT|nr:hypothetical protein [Lignipirellula cremea]QDU98205.1 hypothetical protein Pla8534_60660 [Lignipirellula cremea]